ncbi:MAG: hypothetical protein JWM52_820 [Candidatus Saccharibacteria bacterium]|nr:hypothetical protein [Candidatus Saccharibacteria bacterium]
MENTPPATTGCSPVGVARCELAVLPAPQPGREATTSLLLLRLVERVDTPTCLDRLATCQAEMSIDLHVLAHDDVVAQSDEALDRASLADRDVAVRSEVRADHDIVFDGGHGTDLAAPADHDEVSDAYVGIHEGAALELRVVPDLHPGKPGVAADRRRIADLDLHELAVVFDHDVVADVHVVLEPDVVPDGDVVTDSEAPPDLHLNGCTVGIDVRVGS